METKNLIVTLLSDQTIPNVQFIKDKQNKDTFFLFVTTTAMEKKGVRTWIQKVCKIPEDKVYVTNVDQFSIVDIESKLNEIDYDEYDKIYVNVTGGTKIMSHAATDFFKELGAEIYYLTGANKVIQVYPKKKQPERVILNEVTLDEYLESYGFNIREGRLSGIPFEYTSIFLKLFVNLHDSERRILNELRSKRDKRVEIKGVSGLQDFICNIKFPVSDKDFFYLNKNEVKYLTGDWLEEYVYYRIKNELCIKNENIKTGVILDKNGVSNEFDVIFLLNGNLYIVECKTSIVNKMTENMNILNETIYKATALQKNLGLHSKFSIFTLSSKNDEVKELHLDRGRLFNINIICRQEILECDNLTQFFLSIS